MFDTEARLQEIAELHCTRPDSERLHIITVASGKGGVGKSTVALNVAWHLAQLGRKTLILDADENLGNIDVMTGVSPKMRLAHVLRRERDIEDVLVTLSKNLTILPGNSGDVDYPGMTIQQQRELLNDIGELDHGFEYLVIDTSAGVSEDIINFALHSHETLVVTSPEPTSLMDAYALIKMVSLTDPHVPLKIVVNCARTATEANETARKLQMVVTKFLKRQVYYLGSIPFDTNVTRAIIQQVPLVAEFPSTSASQALQWIAERIAEQKMHSGVRRIQMS